MDFETSLRVVTILSDVLTTPQCVNEALLRVTEMTCVLMETQQAVIVLRDEEHQSFTVRTCVGMESQVVRVGYPLQLPQRIQRILWKLRGTRQIGSIEAGIEGIGFPILVTPLRVKGDCIGLVITGKSLSGKLSFDPIRRRLFLLIASFASLAIENAKVYDYLRQQFAQRSQELIEANRIDAGGRDEAEQLMISSLRNPNKVVRLLALSFYKELARAGFTPAHITTAAAEILDCIAREEYEKA